MNIESYGFTPERIHQDRRLLALLAQKFPTASAASTEIINLEAILNLPKGTEHFVADIHGESEAFDHILRNASGNIKRKVMELFGHTMRESEIRDLCTLIYYPGRKLRLIHQEEHNLDDFYHTALHRLVKVLQSVSSKYTRSKVRKALPKEFAYIIEELLHEAPHGDNKQEYYNQVVDSIIDTGQADNFIKAISRVIQRLSIDRMHILGDIYDRGSGAHYILDTLTKYRDFDIQWGNHDALWMGAAAGNVSCITNVLRICLRYSNMATLEDGYGINLVPLATFAWDAYRDDPCKYFQPKSSAESDALSAKHKMFTAQMHKAISVIQFKIEAKLIAEHPEWGMDDRNLLHHIDFKKGTVTIEGREFEMPDMFFPTINPDDPYALTEEEQELIDKLQHSFTGSDKLRKHIDIFLTHGSMYKVYNSNLMFHAGVPLNADGTLKTVKILDKELKGKELYDYIESIMRSAFDPSTPEEQKKFAVDYYWYLWCGPDSPLFDKSKMATFERQFLDDKAIRHEEKGYYFKMRDDEKTCDMILDAFGVEGEHRHIVNGHVPVKASKGEKPIKAGGKMMVIDGGFSKAYHDTTGIAGYTLVYHSRGLYLVQHEPFSNAEDAVRNGTDILSSTQIVELNADRIRVRDTDNGAELQRQIDEIAELLYAYHHGLIPERG